MRLPEGGGDLLVGRERELHYLEQLLEAARLGRGTVVAIEGEPGIGKTRLTQELCRAARARDMETLVGSAGALEAERPFGLIADTLDVRLRADDPRRVEIASLLFGEAAPDGLSGSKRALRLQIAENMLALLESVAIDKPVLAVLEDLQWADAASLMVLSRVTRRAQMLPLLVIVTCRPLPRSEDVTKVMHEITSRAAGVMMLEPLSEDSMVTLASELAGGPPSSELLVEVGRTGGNPLFLTELLAGLREANCIELRAGRVQLLAQEIPPSLRETILRRLAYLPEECADVLEMASVVGSTFELADVALALGQKPAACASKLEAAIKARLVTDAGGPLRFRHDLVHESIYGNMPVAVRKALHVEVARALAAAGRPAFQVAAHFAAGASEPDVEAAAWLLRGAREAMTREPATAVQLLETALRVGGASFPERGTVEVDLVRTLVWADRPLEAAALAAEVIGRTTDAAAEVALRHAAADGLYNAGRNSEALEHLDAALALPGLSDYERAPLLLLAALVRLTAGGPLDDTVPVAEEGTRLARDAGNVQAESEGLGFLGMIQAAMGEPHQGVDLARRAVALAEESTHVGVRDPRIVLAAAHIEADDLEEATTVLRRTLADADARGVGWTTAVNHYWLGIALFYAGAWEDSVTEIETGLHIAEESGARGGAIGARGVSALIEVYRGDLEAARSIIQAALGELAERGPEIGLEWLLLAHALATETSDPDAALATVTGPWDLMQVMGVRTHYRVMGPDLVRLALAAGERDRARSVTEAIEDLAGRMDARSMVATALRCRGLLDRDVEVMLSAVDAARRAPRILDLANTTADAADLLRETSRAAEADALVDEARALYTGLGAKRGLARLGDATTPGGEAAETADLPWDTLSPSEWKVVRCVARGMTNAAAAKELFISRYTVETHMKHVFAKLKVASRTELAARAIPYLLERGEEVS